MSGLAIYICLFLSIFIIALPSYIGGLLGLGGGLALSECLLGFCYKIVQK